MALMRLGCASDQQTASAAIWVTGWTGTLHDNVEIKSIATAIVAEEHPVLRIGNIVVDRQGIEAIRQIGTGDRQADGVLRGYLEVSHEARVSGKEGWEPG